MQDPAENSHIFNSVDISLTKPVTCVFLKEQETCYAWAQEGKACEYLLLIHTLSSCANMTCNKN